MANLYTAKVLACTKFADTKTASMLMCIKTINGRACEDVVVSKTLDIEHPALEGLYKGTEVKFLAAGRTAEPIERKNLKNPCYALVEFDPKSFGIVVPTTVVTDETEASADTIKKRQGMATRAKELLDALRGVRK